MLLDRFALPPACHKTILSLRKPRFTVAARPLVRKKQLPSFFAYLSLAQGYASDFFVPLLSHIGTYESPEAITPMPQTRSIAMKSLSRSQLSAFLVPCLLIFATTPLSATGWHTSGVQIDSPSGAPFVITRANWYGFETTSYVAHGMYIKGLHLHPGTR